MMEKGYIYKVINKINNKIYIGQTTRTLEERWYEHIKGANYKKFADYNNKFHRAIRKYGEGGFIIEIQEEIKASDFKELKMLLDKAEIKWIEFFKSKDMGYNSTYGGDINPMYGVRGKDNPCSVKINQYDLNGHFIKTWDSLSDIERSFNKDCSGISKVCNKDRIKNKHVTCCGYVWRYYKDYTDCKDINISEEEKFIRFKLASAKYQSKSILQYSKDGSKFIKEFKSLKEAAKFVNGNPSGICVVASGKKPSYKGYLWRYK